MKLLKDFPLGTIFYFNHSYSTYCLLSHRNERSYYLALYKEDGFIYIDSGCYLDGSYIEGTDFKVVGFTKVISI